MRSVSVCNALDYLLIHKDRLDSLPYLVESLQKNNVEIFADPASYKALQPHYPSQQLHPAQKEDFGREFLSSKMVDSVHEAVQHIASYTSRHSEAIITDDPEAAHYFTEAWMLQSFM